ncbi:MAG: hypothetical protein MZV64_63830 [Ignavibacteriales bacterium]|nr:hypothetical protein [Ignavibacteriales bacterium]
MPDLPPDRGGVGQAVDGDLDELVHFLGLEPERERPGHEGDRRVDAIVARRDVEGRQPAEDADRPEVRPQLLRGLPEGRGLDGLAGVLLPAGKGDLAAVVQDAFRAAGQEEREAPVLDVKEDEDAGLAAGGFDLEVGFVALARFGGHGELRRDSGESRGQALFDPAEEVERFHGPKSPSLISGPGRPGAFRSRRSPWARPWSGPRTRSR